MKIELIEGGKAPKRMSEGAVGYDCFAREVDLQAGGAKIKLGFKVDCSKPHMPYEIPSTIIPSMDFGAFLFPRSGWASKYGFRLKNTIGVIDPDYRGEVIAMVEFYECPPELLEYAASKCNRCESAQSAIGCEGCVEWVHGNRVVQPRVCQMVFLPCYVGELTQVEKLDDTERADGGFGSTG